MPDRVVLPTSLRPFVIERFVEPFVSEIEPVPDPVLPAKFEIALVAELRLKVPVDPPPSSTFVAVTTPVPVWLTVPPAVIASDPVVIPERLVPPVSFKPLLME